MVRVDLVLDSHTDHVPDWWRNFGVAHPHLISNDGGNTQGRIDVVNQVLMDWHAQVWLAYTDEQVFHSHVDFYDEQAMTWFLMRWS